MGEALIWYRRRGGVDPELLKPTTITNNGNYTAPITGTYTVYSVGGGGGGGGGCRNAWNVSQVFYGGAGFRGTLNIITVNLNQGDNVTCTIGSGGTGGTNNTTRTYYSNGTWNSRGTSGTSGGSTSFGSYGSGSGGTYGSYSWSRTYWSNSIQSWNNGYKWNNTKTWDNNGMTYVGQSGSGAYESVDEFGWSNSQSYDSTLTHNYYWGYPQIAGGGTIYNSGNGRTIYRYANPPGYENLKDGTQSQMMSVWNMMFNNTNGYEFAINNHYERWISGGRKGYMWQNRCFIKSIREPYNIPIWNNKILNTSTRCYTSIQVGTRWYLSNNTVTTSGSRLYRGDGGNSGIAGNAGYILVIPPQS